ncbi:serine carboxypeptidase-like 18, partial [Primulina tabacum]|uniref:serine carboxypeptidase-like 18 n=1 Tax=Primulina tabacum TaxID=48773 RepID=UPI003F5A5920
NGLESGSCLAFHLIHGATAQNFPHKHKIYVPSSSIHSPHFRRRSFTVPRCPESARIPRYSAFQTRNRVCRVGEDEDVQLFYYFVESERDPEKDPLVFWINGRPGCSGFSGLVYEIGPLNFDHSSLDGSLPSFILNSYSWTNIASIIFVDAPVGTGFSYANTSRGYHASDTKSTSDNFMFLRKWLLNHPSFFKNRLYVAGDSYGGKIVPMVAFEIVKGNDAGLQSQMNLQGYLVGNSKTDVNKDSSETVAYAHQMALISDEYYELAKSSCNGEYVNLDPNNIQCVYALRLIIECTKNLFKDHILEPNCKFISPRPDDYRWGQTIVEDVPEKFLFLSKNKRSHGVVTKLIGPLTYGRETNLYKKLFTSERELQKTG